MHGPDLDLTPAEQAELDADIASGGAATNSAAAAPPAPANDDAAAAASADADAQAAAKEPAPAAPVLAAADNSEALARLAETQERTAAALDAVAQRLQPAPAAAEAAPAAPTEPDWDKLKTDLRGRYDRNEIDDEEYEREREALLERKAEHRAEQRAADLVDRRLQEDAKQRAAQVEKDAEARWNSAVDAFSAQPLTQKLFEDDIRRATFQHVLNNVAAEKPTLSYAELLVEARNRTLKAFNMEPAPAKDPGKEIQAALAQRQEGARPAPDLSRAPNAGAGSEGNDKFASLDSMDINSLEDHLARLPEHEIDRYLEDAPGGLRDNPRGA
jgi:hypothetical protein